jgi:outer membrane protein OmpA-like peptidoglycan-associated protein
VNAVKRFLFSLSLVLSSLALAQDAPSQTPGTVNPSNTPAQTSQTQQQTTNPNTDVIQMEETPVFRVNVVGRTTQAVNYHFRSGSTKVDLKGTELMPTAKGTARVESHLGRTEIRLDVGKLDSPQKFGKEYLTYVAWAIDPQGRTQNLGEIVLDGGKEITVTTPLQAFGLVITAEPYFAVSRPSDLVVMENVIRKDTVGATELINTRYELIGRGQYIPPHASYDVAPLDMKTPLPLLEARNAVRIAQMSKADKYAADVYQRAVDLLKQSEEYWSRKYVQKKPVATVAREATQAADNARNISLQKQLQEYEDNQRAAAQAREDEARRRAQEEAAARQQAETTAQEATRQREEAQRQAEERQRQAEAAARAQQEAETARQAALLQQQQAEAERQRAQLAAEQAEQQRLQAEREKEEMRARLLQQLNTVLDTRDTQRGLIVNMADVLFDTGQSTLRPAAREKLAKVSGIVLAYPGLKLQVEGHTDSVGSEAYNQKLSEKRAENVRAYLVKQGVSPDVVTSMGFGKSQPVATNTTAAGRQQNRRVEMVVSGEVIGTKIGGVQQQQGQQPSTAAPTASPNGQQQVTPNQSVPATAQPALPQSSQPATPPTSQAPPPENPPKY